MDPKHNGGPAFPLDNPRMLEDGDLFKQFPGMSLRDWFAGQALAGWLASYAGADPDMTPDPTSTAALCYRIADAMIKAGER